MSAHLLKFHVVFLAINSTHCVHAKSLQSCLTLCDPIGCSPPGSSVQGILQARILEWVAVPSSRGWIFPTEGLNPGLLHCRQIIYHLSHLGSPSFSLDTINLPYMELKGENTMGSHRLQGHRISLSCRLYSYTLRLGKSEGN